MIRLALLLALCLAGRAEAANLRSPWDVAPPALTSSTYVCASAAVIARDVGGNGYYTDPAHSKIDPAALARNQAAQKPIDAVMTVAEAAADRFVATGSGEAAKCAVSVLEAQARGAAMTGRMETSQSYYVQHWTLGALAIAYLKVRPAGVASAEQAQVIGAWLHDVAVQVRANMVSHRANPKNTDSRNNHEYWAGMAVMAAGVAAGDQALYDWGSGTYDDGLSRIEPDGTLPLEMARGEKALHYHVFAVPPLVVMAEFGLANGMDFYSQHNGALHRLAERCFSGLADNAYFAEKAGIRQDTPGPKGIASSDLIWAKPYARRFPNAAYDRLAAGTRFTPFLYLGGMPPP
jgi:poly(beta-D-mannuronate) lyase